VIPREPIVIALLQVLTIGSNQFRRAVLEENNMLSFQKKMLHRLLPSEQLSLILALNLRVGC
jgi:hypothetical protein